MGEPDIAGQLLQRAESFFHELVGLRRRLHQEPELGFEEHETRILVRNAVERYIPEADFRDIAGTGLLVGLPGESGPTVLLRVCLDALPIEDRKTADYASRVQGKSHACGHDGQMTMLVGALRLLAEQPPHARVYGLFQPAEEIDAGARAVLEEGLMESIHPDVIFGIHGHPSLDAGTIGVKAGPIMAAITTVHCEVIGREGHGAEPHLTADALTAAASLVLDWQVALGRRIDPRQPVVLSVGRLASGVTANVVPGRAEIDATLRFLDPGIEHDLNAILTDVAKGVEARTGTEVRVTADPVVPPVVNDGTTARIVAEATADLLGPGAVVDPSPSLGGDDFAWYLRHVPGCYFFVGERRQEKAPYGWHDPAYDLDERALAYGSAVLAAVASKVGEGGMR